MATSPTPKYWHVDPAERTFTGTVVLLTSRLSISAAENFALELLHGDGPPLQDERFDDAVAVFELNVELLPQDANAYDSLGEAFMTRGDTEKAIANYEYSLELNPDNDNAVQMLDKLRR